MTPLYIACYNGHDKVVQVFLDHGVQVDVTDKVNDILCFSIKWNIIDVFFLNGSYFYHLGNEQ